MISDEGEKIIERCFDPQKVPQSSEKLEEIICKCGKVSRNAEETGSNLMQHLR